MSCSICVNAHSVLPACVTEQDWIVENHHRCLAKEVTRVVHALFFAGLLQIENHYQVNEGKGIMFNRSHIEDV